MAGPYNANARVSELVPEAIEIGEKSFKVRRSGKALKAIIELSPEEGDEEANRDNAGENIEALYKGLSFLLIDPEKEDRPFGECHPDPEWLEDYLDFGVAQELMETLVPRRDEGNAATNGSETAPSTPT